MPRPKGGATVSLKGVSRLPKRKPRCEVCDGRESVQARTCREQSCTAEGAGGTRTHWLCRDCASALDESPILNTFRRVKCPRWLSEQDKAMLALRSHRTGN